MNGHLAMMAIDGMIVQNIATITAVISKVPVLDWVQVVTYVGFMKLSVGLDGWNTDVRQVRRQGVDHQRRRQEV